ncbi:glycosyltransferase [Marinobacter sp. SS13-12]|uniref:glycosyltransferase n=1 Tax=Marinobacter sp. SS13-12 TaxID=3050451 RepID=UPI002553F0B2|nr:glycosyltransferase [Marinobacter sp. SS13-12]MDK8465525.1 glycosyltransferase [Marinobacter sp. SS13-12]
MAQLNFFAFCVIIYSCLVYPLLLVLFGKCFGRPNREAFDCERCAYTVSHIVAVFNGAKSVSEKIEDILATAPSIAFYELIIVTDGCTDNTAMLVAADTRVRLIELPHRVGKEAALIAGVKEAAGEIIIFSDLGTKIKPGSVSTLLNNFSEKKVGVVGSVDCVAGDRYSLGAFFIRFEMMLRRYESKLSSCVGVSGSYFAARKHLCKKLKGRGCSDLDIAMIAVRSGYRALTDERVKGYYSPGKTFVDEFERKQRTIVHGMSTISSSFDLLAMSKHGWFSWQLFSHKILRWFTAICVVWLTIYVGIEAVIMASYPVATVVLVLGLFLLTRRTTKLSSIGFLTASLTAVLGAVFALFTGKQYRIWKPSNK